MALDLLPHQRRIIFPNQFRYILVSIVCFFYFPRSKCSADNELELPEIGRYTKQPPAELVKAITAPNHIVFDFTLIERGLPRMPKGDELSILGTLFPTQFALTVVPPMLTIHVRMLPPKPWPLTVTGLPLYLTTGEWNTRYDHGRPGAGPKALTHKTSCYEGNL